MQSFKQNIVLQSIDWHRITLKDKSKVGVIFDTISVKARWERWCRWNCDLRVINARKKAFSVVPKASPWRPNHVTICLLRHAIFHGVCEIALTEELATQMGMMRCSKKVSSFELYKFNPLSPHCGSIARELVHCYTWGRLRIVTVRGNTVGRHS